MKLNLSKIQRESEDDDFFHLNDGKGAFRVAKAGLSDGTRQLITQHFAQGGEVLSTGPEPSFWDTIGYKPAAPMSAAPPSQVAPEVAPAPAAPPTPAAKPLLEQSIPEALGTVAGYLNSGPNKTSNFERVQGGYKVDGTFVPEGTLSPEQKANFYDAGVAQTQARGMKTGAIAPGAEAPPVSGEVAPATVMQQPRPMPAAPPAGGGGGFALPPIGINSARDEREMAAANQQAQGAIQKQADVAAQRAQAEAAIREDAQLKRDARLKEIDGRIASNQQRADKLSADIASSQVDPNHFWASKSTGQKVASTIAIILGGLGQGLLRSNSNAVIDLMNKQIGDDIEAQRVNLGKKQSLLGDYLKQGNDLQQSRELAAADMKDILAGQLAASAAKFGGPEAQALAQQQAAQLKATAVQQRLGVRAQHMDMAVKQSVLEENALMMRLKLAAAVAGKPQEQMTAGEASKVGDMQAGIKAAESLREAFKKKTGFFSALTQYIPGTDAKEYRDKLGVVTQLIGGFLEGGKLTDDDYQRYMALMPQPGDGHSRAMEKINTVVEQLGLKRDELLKAQKQAGYNTSGFAGVQQAPSLKWSK